MLRITRSIKNDLIKIYSEVDSTNKTRHYHNFYHIENMLERGKTHFKELTVPQILAIYFHDIVYKPYSKSNELESAMFMFEYFGYDWASKRDPRNKDLEELAKAADMILATAKHLEDQDNLDLETKIVLDLDLSGFGDNYSAYIANSNLIRKEMFTMTVTRFIRKRITFLEAMLKRNHIFYTDQLRVFEDTARSNISQELWTLDALINI